MDVQLVKISRKHRLYICDRLLFISGVWNYVRPLMYLKINHMYFLMKLWVI